MNTKTLKILLSLFAINSITLYLYFSSNPDYFHHKRTENHSHFTNSRSLTTENHFQFQGSVSTSKPWPILPSYLPWSQNIDVPFGSCEGYFGNGFTRRIDALKPSPDSHRKFASSGSGGGWFRCFYSDTLRSSICEAGRLRMSGDKILMSRGGEKLETVVGREEEDELPIFQDGAFEIEVTERSRFGKKLVNNKFLDNYLEEGVISRHTMRSLVDSIRLVGPNEFHCSEVRFL